MVFLYPRVMWISINIYAPQILNGVWEICEIYNNWHSPTVFVWKKSLTCRPTIKFAFGAKVHSNQTTHTAQNKSNNNKKVKWKKIINESIKEYNQSNNDFKWKYKQKKNLKFLCSPSECQYFNGTRTLIDWNLPPSREHKKNKCV